VPIQTWSGSPPTLPYPKSCTWSHLYRVRESANDRHSIYSAGGTILSASNYSRLDNVNYGSGRGPTPEDLIGNVSEVLSIAQLAVVRFQVPGGSSGLNSSLYLNISQHANRQLCSEGSDIAGAIMFHGTNTLEETVRTPPLQAGTRDM
jgi:L-asparaginase